MALRPTKYPKWASVDEIDPITGNANKVEPPLQWQNSGVKRRQPVPRQYLNYHNDLTSDWIEYLDEQVSAPTPIPNILDAVYPVGSVHLSVISANPTTYGFPGTWAAIAQGKSIFGVDTGDSDFNAARKTGGTKSHQHTVGTDGMHDHGGSTGNTALTIAQMPSHTHESSAGVTASGGLTGVFDGNAVASGTIETGSEGGGLPHNHLVFNDGLHTHNLTGSFHLNPYYCVYIWERVS